MNAGGASLRPGVAALSLMLLLVYWPALAGPFQFDDWWAIVDNPEVHSLAAWWRSLPGIRPLLKLAHALNWEVSATASAFRAVNLALHLINTALVAVVAAGCHRLLGGNAGRARFVAWGTAALFALHPAATEAVSYISGRSISLMATFYLAAFVMLIDHEPVPTRARLALATLLFAAALATRETALTLPFALLLLQARSTQPVPGATRALRWQWALLLLATVLAALTPGYRSFFSWSLQTRDLGAQLYGQLSSHWWLLSEPLLGLRSNIDPEVPLLSLPAACAFVAAALAGLALAWRWRQRMPWLLFGLGWYVLHLLPTNSLLPRFDLANDRHLYLALIGPAFALVSALALLPWPPLRPATLSLLLLLLGSATWQRNHDYRSELALWNATVRDSPDKARPRINLGVARQERGDEAGARRAYRCALALDPNGRQARVNLAVLPNGPVDADPRQCDPP